MLDVAYPRPQLQRDDWTPLDGPWRFRWDDDQALRRPDDIADWPLTIKVPFPPESQASGIGDRGFHSVCWYPLEADITGMLEPSGHRVITVRAEDDPLELTKPRDKQDWQREPQSIWYPRTTCPGIRCALSG